MRMLTITARESACILGVMQAQSFCASCSDTVVNARGLYTSFRVNAHAHTLFLTLMSGYTHMLMSVLPRSTAIQHIVIRGSNSRILMRSVNAANL